MTSDITLTSEQTAALTDRAAFGSLASEALIYAALVPMALCMLCFGLARAVNRVPLIGWIFAPWLVRAFAAGSVSSTILVAGRLAIRRAEVKSRRRFTRSITDPGALGNLRSR